MSAQIDIASAGMVTAVGLDAASSCAAMRARLEGFVETSFVSSPGEWLVGAPAPLPRAFIGEKRLAHMAAASILEATEDYPDARKSAVLILCLAEGDRPGRVVQDAPRLAARIADVAGLEMTAGTYVVAYGRPSGHVAIQQARRILAEGRCPYVIVCGVDSYLTGRTIDHYLATGRLLTSKNPNGFIPGEAAAAVLCARPGMAKALGVLGLGLAREPASIYNNADLPFRADGMTSAYQSAFNEAGCQHSNIVLKIGDLPGESFWFKQTALAMLRTQRERSAVQPIWAVAASLGNIGAAVVPLMLGWALHAGRKGYGPKGPVLVESSGDNGVSGALVARVS